MITNLAEPVTGKTNLGTPAFAHYIAGITQAKLTGVFLERNAGELVMVIKNMHEFPDSHKYALEKITGKQCCGKCSNKVAADAAKFSCKDDSITGETNLPVVDVQIDKVIVESRFTDLLILDAKMCFDTEQKTVLSAFTKEVLTRSECPVMIAPYAFDGIEEIIFAYDGSSSAMFAIKQFSHLFPSLTDKKLTVLQVNSKKDDAVTEKDKIRNLLQMHYSSIGFDTITGIASEELYTYLLNKRNAIVVMGAFGPNHLSVPHQYSTAEPLVKTINLPLFIAHQ
jgi:hypothetical protein